MKFKSFLKLVEIQTKVASVIPFTLGTLVSIYLYGHFNLTAFLLMLGSLLCIDMATTAINNYVDYTKAIHTTGYGYNGHNAIVTDQLNVRTVQIVIICLILMATVLGVLLFAVTDWLVLFTGALAFVIGIGYTYGPVPISRTPFGEVVSGVTMGFGIVFLAAYIHIPDPHWLSVKILPEGMLSLSLAWYEFLRLFVIALPLIIGIGNIMFANNICDREEDWNNHRYTLALSLGLPWSLRLFASAYVAAYLSIAVGVILGLLPIANLGVFLTCPVVYKQTLALMKNPVKQLNFVNAVKNFVLISVSLCVTWLIALII